MEAIDYNKEINKNVNDIFKGHKEMTEKVMATITSMNEKDQQFFFDIFKDMNSNAVVGNVEKVQESINKIQDYLKQRANGS